MDITEVNRTSVTPDERRRGPIRGIPLKMSDGREWLLAHGGISGSLTELRDRLYELSTVRNSVRVSDAYQVAWVLLDANYDLSPEEAGELLSGAETDELVNAAMTALFGTDSRQRGWTEWATTGLIAAGLDPAKIPAWALPAVLDHLELSGRIAKQEEFIGPAIWVAKRRRLGAMNDGQ